MKSLASVILITFTYVCNQLINFLNRNNISPRWLPLLRYSLLLAHQSVLSTPAHGSTRTSKSPSHEFLATMLLFSQRKEWEEKQ